MDRKRGQIKERTGQIRRAAESPEQREARLARRQYKRARQAALKMEQPVATHPFHLLAPFRVYARGRLLEFYLLHTWIYRALLLAV